MFCKICGKFIVGSKCIYCGKSFNSNVVKTPENSNLVENVTYKAPSITTQYEEKSNKTKEKNSMAVVGFVLSFLGWTALFGLIFSIIGLKKSFSMNGEGKKFSICGIVFSVWTIALIIFYVIFLKHMGAF